MNFWSDFWPNFSSTLLGLLLGLPIALWTNRFIVKKQEAQNKKFRQQKLEDALKILRQTLEENRKRLAETIQTIKDGKVQFDTQLDISVWDAVKDDIVEYLHDPDLKKRIAYHFQKLNTITKLNTMYLDFSAGIGSALGGVEKTRDSLKSTILASAVFLVTDVAVIQTQINKALNTSEATTPNTG